MGIVALYDFCHEMGILHDNAASCGLGYLLPHPSQELRLCIEFSHVAGIGVEEVGCHLDDRTELQGSRRGYVVTHTCSSRTNGLSLVVPIDINEDDWSIEAFVDKELT